MDEAQTTLWSSPEFMAGGAAIRTALDAGMSWVEFL